MVGFGYLASILVIGVLASSSVPASPEAAQSEIVVTATPHYQDFTADLTPMLTRLTGGTVHPAQLRQRNPALWQALQMEWSAAATAGKPFSEFGQQTASTLNAVLGAALKSGNDKLLTDFAAAYN